MHYIRYLVCLLSSRLLYFLIVLLWLTDQISLPVIETDEEYTHLHTEIAFEIDTSRGICAVKATHMDPVEDVVDRFVVTRNVVGTLLFLVAIVVFLKMYWQYQTTQSYQQDYDWLNDFYLHNAPEVYCSNV